MLDENLRVITRRINDLEIENADKTTVYDDVLFTTDADID